jgi:D-3-phosphoglycerate dehydrogenase
MKTVLIAIDEFATASDEPIKMLEQSGFKVLVNDTGEPLDYKKNPEMYASADYVIAGLEPYTAEFFNEFDNISVISRIGVGTDCIDLLAATNSNVKVMITSDKPSVAVAELCISNMISLLRSTFKMSNHLKSGQWMPIQGTELRSCTVGVIGMGSIGKEVLKRVHAFKSNLIAYSRTWDDEFANKHSVKQKTLKEIFKESDVITIHLPLTSETNGLIGEDLIQSAKKNTIILNTSRAGVIDNVALAKALKGGKLFGASVDVFDEERDPYPYGDLDNVILTPHIGSHTIETRKSMEVMAVENILMFESLSKQSQTSEIKSILSYVNQHSVNS